jgi:hypothetical protein
MMLILIVLFQIKQVMERYEIIVIVMNKKLYFISCRL